MKLAAHFSWGGGGGGGGGGQTVHVTGSELGDFIVYAQGVPMLETLTHLEKCVLIRGMNVAHISLPISMHA